MNITLNPGYVLKNDCGCVLLLAKQSLADNTTYDESVNSVIHPFYAKILSFVNGDSYDTTVKSISNQLKVPIEKVRRFVDSLIENEDTVGFKYKDMVITFPKRTILNSSIKRVPSYQVSDFNYSYLDLQIKRHKTPSSLTLMLNNVCVTNCIYCYADKRKRQNCCIPLERIKMLLKEAKELGVVNFDLIGGEVFLYESWKDLVEAYLLEGFNPFLSTKVPISEDDVRCLSRMKLPFLQISLDTCVVEHSSKVLKVGKGYLKQMEKTFSYLEKWKINIVVHTIITQMNDNREDIISIFDFLKRYVNIRYWLIEIAGPSIYTGEDDYNSFKPRKNNIKLLREVIRKCKSESPFLILDGLNKSLEEEIIDENIKLNAFMDRGLCSGNFSHLFILPNGDVTICEELYWNQRFVIGNILKSSLEEVWNSPAAKDLFYISQEDFPIDSPCHSCDVFDECRSVRHICYRDTVKAYGEDKWYYPDVNCPKAPAPTYSIKL